MSQVKNIPVFIRAKPNKDKKCCWCINNNSIQAVNSAGQKVGDVYSFDHIFDETQSNEDIYKVVEPTVISAMDGYNTTIFTYGQTSSGKTYTMMGESKVQGIVQMSFQSIFKIVEENPKKRFLIRLSIIEIYNEKINDLLDNENTNVKIRETQQGSLDLQVKSEVVTNVGQVLNLAKIGNKNRKIGSTDVNERSSRSHLIFRIAIETIDMIDGQEVVNSSQMNLVDLAGSERLAQTGAQGERLKEGVNINKSLSNLTKVIRQLNDEGTSFVSFRDSKLTRLLKDSLGGNANTMVIANITLNNIEETLSTLNFAKEASMVKNKAIKNEYVTVEKKETFEELTSLASYYEKKLVDEMQRNAKEQEKRDSIIKELEDKLKALTEFNPVPQLSLPAYRKQLVRRRYTLHDPVSFQRTSSKPPDIRPGQFSSSSESNLDLPPISEELSPISSPAKMSEPPTPEPVLRQRCLEWEQSYKELASYVSQENQMEEGVNYKEEFQRMRENYFQLKIDFENKMKQFTELPSQQDENRPTDEIVEEMKEQIGQLKLEIKQKDKIIAEYQECEIHLRKKLDELMDVLSEKEKMLAELRSELNVLQAKYEENLNQNKDLLKEIDEYKEHATRLIVENKDIHLKYDNIMFEKNDLEIKLSELDKLQNEIKDLKVHNSELIDQNKELKKKNNKLNNDMKKNSKTLENALNLQDDLQREIESLRLEVCRFDTENNDINLQLESAYEKNDRLENDLENMRKEKENMQHRLDSKIEELKEENKELKELLSVVENEANEKQKGLELQLNETRLQLEHANEKNDCLETDLRQERDNIQFKLNPEIEQLKNENQRVNNLLSNSEKEIRSKTEELDRVRREKSSFEHKYQHALDQKFILETQKDILQREKKNVIEKKQNLEMKLEKFEIISKEHAELKQNNEKLSKELDSLGKNFKVLILEIDTFEGWVDLKLNTINKTISGISAKSKRFELNKLMFAKREAETKVIELQTKIEAFNERLEKWEEKEKLMEGSIRKAEDQSDQLLRENKKLFEENNNLKMELASVFTVPELFKQIQIIAEETKSNTTEEDFYRMFHKRICEELPKEMNAKQRDYEQLMTEKEEVEEKLKQAENEIHNKEVELKCIVLLNREFQAENDELKNAVEKAKRQAFEFEMQRDKLERQLRSVEELEGRRSTGSPKELKTRRQEMFDKHRHLETPENVICPRCNELKRRVGELELRLKTKDERYKSAMEKYANRSYTNSQLKKQIEKITMEKDKLQLKLEEDIEKLKFETGREIHFLQKQLILRKRACDDEHIPKVKYEMIKKVCESRKAEIQRLQMQLMDFTGGNTNINK